jgi:hypothetical protein
VGNAGFFVAVLPFALSDTLGTWVRTRRSRA